MPTVTLTPQASPSKLPLQSKLPLPLKNLNELKNTYDVFIFDLWGVVHNGKNAFPDALDTLQNLKNLGKPVYFLSNAPRRKDAAKAQLVERGVRADLYEDLYTSGEEVFEHLRDRPDAFYKNLGTKLYHLGPEKDKNLFQNLPYEEVTDLASADFILNTGTLSFEDKLSDYENNLKDAAHLALPMICANPDKFVIFGGSEAICAGLIAERYENMGGFVRSHGKPFEETYQRFFKDANMENKKILMLGDSLRTDIKGCNNAKIDSVWVTSGIHHTLSAASYPDLFKEYGATPTYVMEKVEW